MGKYDRGMLGKTHSEETKKKLSEKSNKLWADKKYRQRVIDAQSGKNSSRWKGGYALKGIPTFDEYSDRICYAEKTRRSKEDINILETKCTYCGKWFIPRRIDVTDRIRSLEGRIQGECRLYCSNECKQECPIYYQVLYYKNPEKEISREVQAELRQICFKRDNYTCQKCNKHKDDLDIGLHCHHIEGIRWEPLESADLDKVMTLCKTCHEKAHRLPDCGYNDMKCK
jgi:5-methylcytosine-specific restriction endonuclease McrA